MDFEIGGTMKIFRGMCLTPVKDKDTEIIENKTIINEISFTNLSTDKRFSYLCLREPSQDEVKRVGLSCKAMRDESFMNVFQVTLTSESLRSKRVAKKKIPKGTLCLQHVEKSEGVWFSNDYNGTNHLYKLSPNVSFSKKVDELKYTARFEELKHKRKNGDHEPHYCSIELSAEEYAELIALPAKTVFQYSFKHTGKRPVQRE